MRKIGLSLVSGICLLAATSANAEGVALTDHQLDGVTAGADLDLSTLTAGSLLSGQFGLGNSPLLRQAAFVVAVTAANEYAAQNPGSIINDEPIIGPALVGLFVWSLSSPSFPVPAPAP